MIKPSTYLPQFIAVSSFAVGLMACGGDGLQNDAGVVRIGDMDAMVVQHDPSDDPPRTGCTDPGCSCTDDSLPINCYPPPIHTREGTTLCAQGSQYCRDGVWSSCESLIQFGLSSATAGDKGRGNGLSVISSALITDAAVCNPCHPDCFTATDRPVSSDLSTSNTSIVRSDGGVDGGIDAGVQYGVTYDPVQAGIRLTILSDTAQRGSLTSTAVCGNSAVEGVEQCDDGNTRAGDGCDNNCLFEAGYYCPIPGTACARSVCGNAIKQGLEQCDDGNLKIGDGCTPQCQLEPTCNVPAPCTPVCGDGKVFPGEQCDDGNITAGDGCSATCRFEAGWTCSTASAVPPDYIDLPIVYRDFVGMGLPNIDAATPRAADGGIAYVHADFENYNPGQKNGMVQTYWELDASLPTYKKPVAVTPLTNNTIVTVAGFNQWYTDDPTVNVTLSDTLRVNKADDAGTYVFDTTSFFPLDGKSGTWVSQNKEKPSSTHNFSFTSEVRFWFVYNPPQTLDFRGDDDVWVFINGKLAVDIGGVHSAVEKYITLNSTNAATYQLDAGSLYEAAVFQAERHTSGSNYRLTLAGFFNGKTSCTSICGDGIVTPNEYCDDGPLNGTVGGCLPDCTGRSPKYAPSASYWRDYAATGTCAIPPERPLWGLLTWQTTTTSGGSITFNLQGAETASGVATATIVPVAITPSAGTGSFNIHDALQAAGAVADSPYLRVTAVLQSSADQKQTPVLKQFDVSHTCLNVE